MKTLLERTDRMTPAIAAPYGSWSSPITADLIVANTVSLIGTTIEGSDTYWLEMRPSEGGQSVLLHQQANGQVREVNAAPFSIRNRVHEYGGGSFVVHQGVTYFSNNEDQRLYRSIQGQAPQPLTPELPLRFADGKIDAKRDRWIGVREDHRVDPPTSSPSQEAEKDSVAPPEPTNTIVAVSLQGDAEGGTVLVSGDDFYACPRISPDGTQLAWVSWNHPHMPWDSADLWVGTFQTDGTLGEIRKIAGGPQEAIVEPKWSPEGQLYFVSDRKTHPEDEGWWRFYRWTGSEVEAVCAPDPDFANAEFGLPHWVFCMDLYAFATEELIVCTYTQNGLWHLALVNTRSGEIEKVTSPYTEISDMQASPERAVFIAGSPIGPTEVVQLDLATRKFTVLKSSSELELDPSYFSVPEQISFPTTGGQVAHGIYYPPTNPEFCSHPSERPPLLVKSHGGPTAAARSCLNLGIQYWTSRGFAVLDVNYRGSSGYGRAYRDALKGQWGIVDVEDCIAGAQYLVQRGDVDGDRLTIDGGSAGGYTTLCALTFHNVFKAGASRYGISDLSILASDTHKFEARYLDSLVGPYPASEATYQARSPIHHVENLSCPVIFFQGLKDEVVPPNQAERMVEVLKAKNLPVAYVPFPEEYHGFRKAENIKRSLDGELFFYSKVFGFKLAQAVEPVAITNL